MTVRIYEGCWGVTLVREFGEDASRLADATVAQVQAEIRGQRQ